MIKLLTFLVVLFSINSALANKENSLIEKNCQTYNLSNKSKILFSCTSSTDDYNELLRLNAFDIESCVASYSKNHKIVTDCIFNKPANIKDPDSFLMKAVFDIADEFDPYTLSPYDQCMFDWNDFDYCNDIHNPIILDEPGSIEL